MRFPRSRDRPCEPVKAYGAAPVAEDWESDDELDFDLAMRLRDRGLK